MTSLVNVYKEIQWKSFVLPKPKLKKSGRSNPRWKEREVPLPPDGGGFDVGTCSRRSMPCQSQGD